SVVVHNNFQPNAPLSISSSTLPNGKVGVAYASGFRLENSPGFLRWRIVSGDLPSGLQLDPTVGVIRGTPYVAGTKTVTIEVASLFPPMTARTTASLTFDPGSGPVMTSLYVFPAAVIGKPYNFILNAVGGTPPYLWSATTELPAGLSL